MQVERIIAKGQVVPLMFSENAVAASQTDAQLPLMAVDIVASLVDGYAMPFAGEVIGVSASLDAAGSAGSLTVGATIGGTEDADSTLTITTETDAYKVVPRGLVPFDAGDRVGAEITTDGSWNGTASDLVALIWVLLNVEGI